MPLSLQGPSHPPPRTRSWLRFLNTWVLLWPLALGISLLYHLQTPEALVAARNVLERELSDLIAGSLTIGKLTYLDPLGHVSAEDLTLFDPSGQPVLRIAAADLRVLPHFPGQPDLQITQARARGVDLALVPEADGLPTLLSALTPKEDPEPDPPGPLDTWLTALAPAGVQVHAIALEDVRVHGSLLGVHGLDVTQLEGQLALQIEPELVVRLQHLAGRIVGPFNLPNARFRKLDLALSGNPEHTVEAHGYVTSDRTDGEITIGVRHGHLALTAQVRGLDATTLQGVGMDWAAPLRTHFDGTLTLEGPPDALSLSGQLASPAGPVTLRGELTERPTFYLSTTALQLNRALKDGPPALVNGQLRLRLPKRPLGPIALRASLGPTRALGMAWPPLALRGNLQGDTLQIRALNLEVPHGTLEVTGKVSLDGASELQVVANLQDLAADPRIHRWFPTLGGALTGMVTIKTAADAPPSAEGTVRFASLRYGALRAGSLQVQGQAGGPWNSPTLALHGQGQGLSWRGRRLGAANLQVTGHPDATQPDPASRNGLAHYTLSGTLEQPGSHFVRVAGRTQLHAHGFRLDADQLQIFVGRESLRGTLKGLQYDYNGNIDLDRLLLESRSQRLEARGRLHQQGQGSWVVVARHFDLTTLRPLLGDDFPMKRGHADGRLEIEGNLRAPIVRLDGSIQGTHVHGFEQVRLRYGLHYAAGKADLQGDLELDQGSSVHLQATSQLPPSLLADPGTALAFARYDIELSTQGVRLQRLAATVPWVQDGFLDGSLSFHGTQAHPELQAKLHLRRMDLGDGSPLNVRLSLDYNGTELHTHTHVATRGGPVAQISSSHQDLQGGLHENLPQQLLRRAPFDLQAQLNPRRADSLPGAPQGLLPDPWLAHAQFTLQRSNQGLVGSAHWAAFPEAHPDPTKSTCSDARPPQLSGTFALTGEQGQFSLALHHPSDPAKRLAQLDGTVDIPLAAWLRGHTEQPLTRLQLLANAEIGALQQIPYLCDLGHGSLRGRLALQDGLTDQPRIEAEVHSRLWPAPKHQTTHRRVTIRSCPDSPALISSRLFTRDKTAHLQARWNECGGGPIDLTAALPILWPRGALLPSLTKTQDLQGTLRFAKAQLRPLLDRLPGVLTAEGQASGEVRFSGPAANLAMDGTIALQAGKVVLQDTGQQLQEIGGKLVFEQQTTRLEDLTARAGDGRLTVNGEVDFQAGLPRKAQLALDMASASIVHEGERLANLSGQASLTAALSPERADGKLRLRDLRIQLPARNPTQLQTLEEHGDIVVVNQPQSGHAPESYPFALKVISDNPIHIQRNDFDARVRANLEVLKEQSALRLDGFLEFRRGEFQVFGKDFEIVQGSLKFPGTKRGQPEANLTAVHRVSTTGETVTVQVDGRLSDPDIRFLSDSCEGQAGALTLLLTGQCTASRDQAAPDSSTEGAFAAGLLQGVLTLGAQQEFGGLVPKLAVESGQGYSTRVKAGVSSDEVIPPFLRKVIQKVYLQGAVSTAQLQDDPAYANQDASLDFLIELYFPHSIVGSGHFATDRWGLDVTWEP